MKSHQNPREREMWLRILSHTTGILPLILLLWGYLRGNLGFNPIETTLRRTGHTAVIFLLLSLSCTPIQIFIKYAGLDTLRKLWGLYAAFYAMMHFLTFAVWDYGLNLPLIWGAIIERPFIIMGSISLVILGMLAITSIKSIRIKLGRWWRPLHRLVYPAAIMVIWHYLLAVKGDLLSLQGNYTPPLIAGVILILLLIFRTPLFNHTARWLNRNK